MPPSLTGNPIAAESSNVHEVDDESPDNRPTDDDRILVERVRAGDHDAYAALVERYGTRLYHSLFHLACGDGDQAAEFVQEAFVRAFERLDRFAGTSSFYTWLYRLARNRAIDLLAKRRPQAIDNEILDVRPGTTAGPEDDLSQRELQAAVHQALYRLPAATREILLMRDFQDLDYTTIAAHLDIPNGTVKSRINRARRALRDELAPLLSGADL
jgi:RNA polymerase sigma-70 factor, ECF subfamily